MSYNNFQDKTIFNRLPDGWKIKQFKEIFQDVSSGNVKLNKSEYLPSGEFPIIDQGKEQIAGFTNNVENLINSDPPFVIFGDHTRVIKYFKKKFVLGADGVKVLKAKNNYDNVLYLYYFLKSLKIPDTGYNRHYKFLKDVIIPIPSREIQQKIASVLLEADTLLQKRKAAIAKLDELVQSIFLDIFGDLSQNSKKWTTIKLENVAELSSGVTKGKKYKDSSLLSVPYMRVANVQDGYIDLTEVKEIIVSKTDAERYKLNNRDVLLTEGGDPDKLGRGAVWKGEIQNCIHQNHIFRVRVNPDVLNPFFLAACTGSNYGKKYFLKMAKQTTGIATINMTQLKSFPVPLPALKLQNKFESILNEIDQQINTMEKQLTKLEENFQSLLHQAFTGQLQFNETKVNDYAIKR